MPWIENPRVGSSILPLATNHFCMFLRHASCLIIAVSNQTQLTMSRFQQISASDLNSLLNASKAQLLDVRNDDEVARGIIHGALHIPLHLLPMRWNELDDETPLAIYCHSGVRSMHACEYLAQQGYTQLFNLQGGILAWANAGLPIVSKGSA